MNRREETLKVKKAIKETKLYKGVRVTHGRGTGWGWLNIEVTIPRPEKCKCTIHPLVYRCDLCTQAYTKAYNACVDIAQDVTGRTGEYDGRIHVQVNFDPRLRREGGEIV